MGQLVQLKNRDDLEGLRQVFRESKIKFEKFTIHEPRLFDENDMLRAMAVGALVAFAIVSVIYLGWRFAQ